MKLNNFSATISLYKACGTAYLNNDNPSSAIATNIEATPTLLINLALILELNQS